MRSEKDHLRMRSFHGHYADLQNSNSCYFNPFAELNQLPVTSYRYLFPDLARATFDDNYCHEHKRDLIGLLDRLGDLMVDIVDNSYTFGNELNSRLPAGYAFFGQFIAHDISAGADRSQPFQITKDEFDPVHPNCVVKNMVNLRTTHLDLNGVYGGAGAAFRHFPEFYQENDPIKFRIGNNDPNGPGGLPDPELELDRAKPQRDLPRLALIPETVRQKSPALRSLPPTAALIGDLRNDENLILAQLHLAFLKFHNRLVDDLRREGQFASDEALFLYARREMTWCYQWLVIHDFLPKVIDERIAKKILELPDTIFDRLTPGGRGTSFLPLEFSVAAFRFAHSLIRDQYDLNLNYGRGDHSLVPRATFNLLYEFTGMGAALHKRFRDNLPQSWIIQWDRFFAVEQHRDSRGRPFSDRFARKIDVRLADQLTPKGMPQEDIRLLTPEERARVEVTSHNFNRVMKHVAKRNLLRGFLLNMPPAQALIAAINNSPFGEDFPITPLTKTQLRQHNPAEMNLLLQEANFLESTPLWFYLLKEAAVRQGGDRLGELGSWLIGHTLIGFLKKSEDSFLSADWSPAASRIPALHRLSGIMDFLIYAGVAPPRGPAAD